jgi:hypothetical protein
MYFVNNCVYKRQIQETKRKEGRKDMQAIYCGKTIHPRGVKRIGEYSKIRTC